MWKAPKINNNMICLSAVTLFSMLYVFSTAELHTWFKQ